MKKDFSKWHALKTKLHSRQNKKFFHEREVWFCSLGNNVGFEQDGKNDFFERPVIVVRKFNTDIFWGIPLTSQPKKGKFYFKFKTLNRGKCFFSYAILSQIRLFDQRRLRRKLDILNKKAMFILIQKTIKLFPQKEIRHS